MHSLMQLVCHSVQLRQRQQQHPASYLGSVRSATHSLGARTFCGRLYIIHMSRQQHHSLPLPRPLTPSLSVSWHAGRHLSSFQAAQRIVVSYLCGLLLLFAIFYCSLFGQLTHTHRHTHPHIHTRRQLAMLFNSMLTVASACINAFCCYL